MAIRERLRELSQTPPARPTPARPPPAPPTPPRPVSPTPPPPAFPTPQPAAGTVTHVVNELRSAKDSLLNLLAMVGTLQVMAEKLPRQPPPTPASTASFTPAAKPRGPAARSSSSSRTTMPSRSGSLTPNLDMTCAFQCKEVRTIASLKLWYHCVIYCVFSTATLVTAEDILVFTKKADKALKGAICDLARDPKSSSHKAQVVGLLVGLMVVATGHRKCVFMGMTSKEVKKAQEFKKTFLIKVSCVVINDGGFMT